MKSSEANNNSGTQPTIQNSPHSFSNFTQTTIPAVVNGSLSNLIPPSNGMPSSTNINNLFPPIQNMFPVPVTGPSGTPPQMMIPPSYPTTNVTTASPPNPLKSNIILPTMSVSNNNNNILNLQPPTTPPTTSNPQKKKSIVVSVGDEDRSCVNCNMAGKDGRTFTGKYCVREGNQDKYNKFFGKALALGSLCDFCYRSWYAYYTKMRILHPDEFQTMTENSLRGRKKNTEKASPASINGRGGRRRKTQNLENRSLMRVNENADAEEDEDEIIIEKSPLPDENDVMNVHQSYSFSSQSENTNNNDNTARSSMGRRAKRKLSYRESTVTHSNVEEEEEEDSIPNSAPQKKNSAPPIHLDEEEEEEEESDEEFRARRGKASRVKKEEEKPSRRATTTETEDDDDQDGDFKMAKRRYNRRKKIKTEEVELEEEETGKTEEGEDSAISEDEVARREEEMKIIDWETERLQVRKMMQQKSNIDGQQKLVWCDRITVEEFLSNPSIIDTYLFEKRVPIVISNFDKLLKQTQPNNSSYEDLFSFSFLKENAAHLPMQPRDNILFEDLEDWTLGQYLNYLHEDRKIRKPTRLYGKDITCPDKWTQYLFEDSEQNYMPERFRYKGKQDIIMSLDPKLQPITLMVYIGDEGTNTPGHKDLCGSLGHNLMVYAEKGSKTEDDSYAFWTMFGTDDLESVTKFFATHGGSLDEDNSFIPLSKFVHAPFKTYMIEQVLGDFVLVPPNCAHQVINKKGKNIKVAWNTLQVKCLPFSNHVLPIYRTFGKREVYRIKSLQFSHLIKLVNQWEQQQQQQQHSKDGLLVLLRELQILLKGVSTIVKEDWIDSKLFEPSKHKPQKYSGEEDFPHSRICNICLCDIFNRCIHFDDCKSETAMTASTLPTHPPKLTSMMGMMSMGGSCGLVKSENDGIDICLDCFAQERMYGKPELLVLQECVSMKQCLTVLDRSKVMYQQLCSQLLSMDSSIAVQSVEQFLVPLHGTTNSIATIAFELLQKRQQPVKYLCHQCQEAKNNYELIQCQTTQQFYCNECLWNRYTKSLFNCLRLKTWNSPLSKQICNCAPCLQKRGLDPFVYAQQVLSNLQEMRSNALQPFHQVAVSQPPSWFVMGVADYNPDPFLRREDNIELIDYIPMVGMIHKSFVALKKTSE